ncbi:MAG TPA: hypothetical protein VFC00_31790 [Micromonosporaceae bacterium]|nr:hypothetical protein [Micromonosporaceae bacterium]
MQRRAPSAAAVGWTVFAAFMMILLGCWWVIVGIVGLIDDDFYVRTRHYVFEFDTTSWGWIHLIVGAIVLIAGFALYTGAVWARTVGVFVALLAALVAFAWLPWYPIWAILMVVAAISVIWALTAHGRDMAEM